MTFSAATQLGARSRLIAAAPNAYSFRPDTLILHGHFRGDLVAQACQAAWLDAPPSAPLKWTVQALTAVLMKSFQFQAAAPQLGRSGDSGAGDAAAAREAGGREGCEQEADAADGVESKECTRALVRALTSEFSPEERTLLVYRDEGLEVAAHRLGNGLATAHKRFQQLVARVKPIVAKLKVGPDEFELAIAVFRKGAE